MLHTESLDVLFAGVALVVNKSTDVSAHLHVRNGSRRARGFLRSNFRQFFKIESRPILTPFQCTHFWQASVDHSATIVALRYRADPSSTASSDHSRPSDLFSFYSMHCQNPDLSGYMIGILAVITTARHLSVTHSII
jgi:hypothetical protein